MENLIEMKQILRYIHILLFSFLGANAWAQTTSYVLDDSAEREWSTIGNSGSYTLNGPGKTLTFQAKRTAILGFSNTSNFTAETSKDGKTWTNVLSITLDETKTWYDFSVEIDPTAKYVRFETKTGATGYKQIRNVKVTRATLLTPKSSSIDFGNVEVGGTVEKTIQLEYHNTVYPQTVSGTCSNVFFTLVNQSLGETGTATVTVRYKPTSVGAHDNQTMTLNMNGATATFTVSGHCVQNYYFNAKAICNNSTFGTATATIDNQTGAEVNVSAVSVNTSETKTVSFKATPAQGYLFEGWYPNDNFKTITSTDNPHTATLTSSSTDSNKPASIERYARFVVDKSAAQARIDEFKSQYATRTSDTAAAADDADDAQRALNEATTVEEVNAAVALLRSFDAITLSDISSERELGDVFGSFASATSGKTVSYSFSKQGVITFDGTNFTASNGGSVTITAYTTTDETHYAVSVSKSFVVKKDGKDVGEISCNVSTALKVGDEVTDVYAVSNTSIPVEVTIDNTDVLVYVDGKIKAVGAGTATITVSQAETDLWCAIEDSRTVTVTRYHGTLVSKIPAELTIEDELTDLYEASNDFPVTVTSSNNNVVRYEDGKLIARGAGTATVTLTQQGNAQWDELTVSQSVTVKRHRATLSWTGPTTSVIWDQTFDYPAAPTNTRIPLLIESLTPDIAGIEEKQLVVYAHTGTARFRVYQLQTAYWDAVEAEFSFPVEQGTEAIERYALQDLGNEYGHVHYSQNDQVDQTFELYGVGDILTYEVKTDALAFSKYFFVQASVDGQSWEDIDNPTNLSTSYQKRSVNIDSDVKYIRFLTKEGATLTQNYRNIQVTLRSFVRTDDVHITVPPAMQGNTSAAAVAHVEWSNTHPLKGRSTNSNIVVTPKTIDTESSPYFGTTELQITAKSSEPGTLQGNIEVYNYAKNLVIPVSFTAYSSTLNLYHRQANDYTPDTYPLVNVIRSFKAGFNTLALPFSTTVQALTNGEDAEAFAASLTGATYNEHDGYTLYFKKLAPDEAMQPNIPYVLYLGQALENPQFQQAEVAAMEEQQVTYSSWTMSSNYTLGRSMLGLYGVVNADSNIRRGGEGSTLNCLTAYLTYEGSSDVKVSASYLEGDDGEMTDISGVLNDSEIAHIFNLQGQQLPNLQRGVNVLQMKDGSIVKKLIP